MSDDELTKLIALRQKVFGGPEEQYPIIVTAPANKQFRVYVNRPGMKGKMPGQIKVKRKALPDALLSLEESLSKSAFAKIEGADCRLPSTSNPPTLRRIRFLVAAFRGLWHLWDFPEVSRVGD